jgi:hypothetical protein
VPFLVQLFKDSEADIEISSNLLNILGNIAIEDINYRDALMNLKVHSIIIERANRQLQHCPTIYSEQENPRVKRFWHFCFWYLQALGEYEECAI